MCFWPWLTERRRRLLLALAEGGALKAHRDVDGGKVFRLHPLHGEGEEVPAAAVRWLLHHRLVTSNHKFPANSYWLTERGRRLAARAQLRRQKWLR